MSRPSKRIAIPIALTALGGALILGSGCVASDTGAPAAVESQNRPPYQNRYTTQLPRGLSDMLRWRRDQWQLPERGEPQPTPTMAPDLSFINTNARAAEAMQPAATWIGHASVLVQAGGLNVLTDPMFSQRASPVQFIGPQRLQPPGLAIEQLPHIDLVLISHNHYDHLDVDSVRALAAQAGGAPLFVVPLGVKAWFADLGIERVIELDWWQTYTPPAGTLPAAVELMLTPAQHWSGRGLNDRMQTLWGGFAVFTPGFHWYYSGDTGYSPDFVDIRQRVASRQSDGGGFDLALIPIGAYAPRWFMGLQHVDPDEALRIHRDVGAKRSIAVHWGTFSLADEPVDQPPRDLAAARKTQGLADDDFVALAVGQTLKLKPRSAR